MTIEAPLATPAARHARARILALARSGPADPAFLCEVSRQLRLIVPFTGALWSGSDPLTTLAVSPARVENMGAQCTRYWEREFLVPDVNLFRDLALAARPAASLFRATGGRPIRSVRYREFNGELGYGDELRAVFRDGSGVWGIASLWREEGQLPFSVAEEKVLADLAAPIAEAFRRAALLRASATDASPDTPGLLVFDRRGTLESCNDQAEAWLRELPPTVGSERDRFGAALPTEIRGVVALARAIAAGVEQGVARARFQSRGSRWLVVHGFPLRGPQGADGRIAIVIEPAQASEVVPIIAQAYELCPREQQVTQLIARGRSTAQIAQQLYLSPHTVRDYVKSVFAKVGVSSRGELVARLFAERYAAPLRDAIVRSSSEAG